MENRFLVSKEVEFDYGHRIALHNSKCRNLHGHRGKLRATFSGPLQTEGSSTGMVIDFGDLKAILMELHDLWDHGLILHSMDPLLALVYMQDTVYTQEELSNLGLGKVITTNFAPTAENLAYFAYGYISKTLIAHAVGTNWHNVYLEKVEFYETPTSVAIVDRQYVKS